MLILKIKISLALPIYKVIIDGIRISLVDLNYLEYIIKKL